MFKLPDTVTIWNEINDDGAGVKTWARVQANARAALKREKITDKNGDNYISKAVFYCRSEAITDDSKVYLGASGAIEPVDEADDVRLFTQTPSGAADLRKVWL